MTNIVWSILNLFGITAAPTTVQEYLWDLVLIVVGLYVVKYVWLFVIDVFSEMLKMR